jgi:hypothetical protein
MGIGLAAPVVGPISLDTAISRAQEALATYGYPDLIAKRIVEFTNHFYVPVVEKSTGMGALELIVERNGIVHLQPGPSMMWTTKYGHMRGFGNRIAGGPGMRGWVGPRGWGWGNTPTGQAMGLEQARGLATQHLAAAYPGATLANGTAFYGYFTFDIRRAGETTGMLSVNSYTGQVWDHSWHGEFVTERQL